MTTDAFLESLTDLERALGENDRRAHLIRERIAEIRRGRAEGRAYADIVPMERRPIILQLLTESTQALDDIGSRVRRLEARALHDEGLTMDRIATLFGVTRQRVSALLRDRSTR